MEDYERDQFVEADIRDFGAGARGRIDGAPFTGFVEYGEEFGVDLG